MVRRSVVFQPGWLKTVVRTVLVISVSVWTPTSVFAKEEGNPVFSLTPDKFLVSRESHLFAAWNPNHGSRLLTSGPKVVFFGTGAGCSADTANGPVENKVTRYIKNARRLTGVALGSDVRTNSWTPSAETPDCNQAVSDPYGDSFVLIRSNKKGGSIGLYTATGPTSGNDQESFFMPIGDKGRGGRGLNRNIEATFVSYRFDWQRDSVIRPWATMDADDVGSDLKLATTQSVRTFSVGQGDAGQKTAGPFQAKQQLMMTVINPHCFRQMRAKRRLCQVQYLFNLAVYRSGVSDWQQFTLSAHPGVFLDPAQGRLPIVRGFLGGDGRRAGVTSNGAAMYTSTGAVTQHDKFEELSFNVTISFSQFKQALVEAVAKQSGRATNDIVPEDIAEHYGARWSAPSEWVLLSIHAGQEVYNPRMDIPVFIGGNIRSLTVSKAPPAAPGFRDNGLLK